MDSTTKNETSTVDMETINTFFLMGQLKRLTDDSDLKAGVDKLLEKLLRIADSAIKEDSDTIVDELKSMRIIMDSCGGSCNSCASDCG